MRGLLPLFVLISLSAWAQDSAAPQAPSPDSEPFIVGGDVSAPMLLSRVEPEYSPEGLAAQVSGSVIVALTIGADGVPKDMRVVRPLDFGLDEKALEALQKWRFRPGMKGGNPVAVQATLEVQFRWGRTLGQTSNLSPPMPRPSTPVSPQKAQKIERLISLLKLDEQRNANMSQLADSVIAPRIRPLLDSAKFEDRSLLTAEWGKFRSQLAGYLRDTLKFQQVKQEYIRVFDESFSEAEIDSLGAFFGTPAGAKYLNAIPQVTRQLNAATLNNLAEHRKDVDLMVSEWVTEVRGKLERNQPSLTFPRDIQ